MNLSQIQAALVARQLDGWLFCDFRGSDPLATGILALDRNAHRSRRWLYFIPAEGNPTKIVHAIEPAALDPLPGQKLIYLPWQQLHEHLQTTLAQSKRIAMQFSPLNAIPYVSRVDGGTIDLVRTFGVDIVSSADLVTEFEATLNDEQIASHRRAGDKLGQLVNATVEEVGRRLSDKIPTTEYDIQQFMAAWLEGEGLMADHAPIVAANDHAADPHFAPTPENSALLQVGDILLLDVWAKEDRPRAIYADITWMAYLGRQPDAEFTRVFYLVRDARDRAIAFIQEGLAAGRGVRGCDADDACRQVIVDGGFGEYFVHRTGHSIHENTHGNGANLDNLETRDERLLLPRTCCSVEPGIYLPGRFGVRSEVDVLVTDANHAEVTGPTPQREILTLDLD